MKLQPNRGFTLVEIMTTLAIFVIVTTIVFVGNDRFNNTIFLTNLAYDVALTVSRAQSYGINVKQFGTGAESFNTGYGVHFKRGPSQTDPNESDDFSFILFADADRDQDYDNSSEFLERYLIRRGNYISQLWVNTNIPENQTQELDIAFLRPDPDAYFTCSVCDNTTNKVGIEVSSPDGIIKKNIIIGITGQISVE